MAVVPPVHPATQVGTHARARMEDFFQKKVYLETRVKVRANWRQDVGALKEFGYLPP